MVDLNAKCRIIGLTLGEAHINFIKPGISTLTANFALIRDDEELCGLVERRLDWSDKTMKALADLREAMEMDMMDHIFEARTAASTPEPEQI